MDVQRLKDHLIGNETDVVTLLESIGFCDIKRRGSELRFARLPGHNPSACLFDLDTLRFFCFSTDEHTDIFGLIMSRENISFKQSLYYVTDMLKLEPQSFSGTHEDFYDFIMSGYAKHVTERRNNDQGVPVEPIDESAMDPYRGRYNTRFLKDGISFKTQYKFGIGYDAENNKIAIPQFIESGELCGIMGRSNDPDCPKGERWLPIISCRRSQLLYGYHINYAAIQNKQLCVIGESEKFPQQLDSFDCHVGLATCGCNISVRQAQQLKMLYLNRVVIAYDEGLSEDQIRAEAEKLKSDSDAVNTRIGYIFDRGHVVLPQGSKDAPSDHGRAGFSWLMKNAVVWI